MRSFLQAELLKLRLLSLGSAGTALGRERIQESLLALDAYLDLLQGHAPKRVKKWIMGSSRPTTPMLNILFAAQLVMPGLVRQARNLVKSATGRSGQ